MKTIEQVMTPDVTSCKLDDTLIDVAKQMRTHDIGSIPVCQQDQHLVGMITDRDLAVRGYGMDKPGTTKVKEVMTDHLVSAEPSMSVQEASELMAEHQIRRLPIVQNNKLVGIVALGDLALEDQSNLAAGHALEEISEPRELH
ncbi:CBS domain-containing protein [Natronobacillus azotifigens]|uniref:CBS domain-containing protein n=1 Tax=Natronobacillus azotifigens TaxID=472978 RepID=A0A9J6RF76_9BACI|nr:CBS domain-containing protein [Natronobacillus azotifigens]MCZ0703987.1 CBS domain-containing protein [Natronobacillus azotifigens]